MPIFGKKKEELPTTADAIQKLRSTEEILEKKQQFVEKQIADQIGIAKKAGTKNKRVALNALKKKKRLEKQLQQIDGTLSTIEYQREALENANTNTEVFKNMHYASQALKRAQKDTGIEDVDDMMADIQEQTELADEISRAISEPVGFGQEIDEDDLLAELEELEQEEFDEKMLEVEDVVPKLPEAPTADLPKEKKKVAVVDDDDDMRELEAWAS